jgi:ribonuclease E
VDEQLTKALGRKVWLPSGGSLVIDKTEAMTVIDVNTGKFVGFGGTLEETVTRNNLEAAEEIVRQLRLRDVGGIIVIDFIDMVLESNRDLVLRRLLECLGRDRTKHQVAEVTSLGLVQMTRKRVGQGLAEAFADTTPGQESGAEATSPHHTGHEADDRATEPAEESTRSRRKRGGSRDGGGATGTQVTATAVLPEARAAVKATLATIAAAAAHAHEHGHDDLGRAQADRAGHDDAASEQTMDVLVSTVTTGAADPAGIPPQDDDLSLVLVDPEVFELDGDEDGETADSTEDGPDVVHEGGDADQS